MTITFENGALFAKLQYVHGGTLNVQFRNGDEAHHSSYEFRYPATMERIYEMTDLARKIVDGTVLWEHINWTVLWRRSDK